MEIKDITFDDKKELFVIKFDKSTLNASYNLYNQLNLSKGKILNDEEFSKLKDFNDYNVNFSKALNFISYRIRSKKEVYTKLKKEDVPEEHIDKIISKLEEDEYINDYRFAKAFFESKTRINKWSNKRIEYELIQKGISKDIINEFSLNFKEIEFENAKDLAEKKLPQWERKFDGFKLKNKIYTFLSSKGFDYNTIERVLGELL
ncbi:regulatory protein RecX [Lagierella massiliensis]|uniref:regulatory protein RecX n=1 Tax=Lagierella massiliensis TaxID=1689303 RepID=UPI0006D79E8A|nr:RecX family transcriptional regulator [Lagierella massiliensis]